MTDNTENKELPILEQHTAQRLQRLIDRGQWLTDHGNIIECIVKNIWCKYHECAESNDFEPDAMDLQCFFHSISSEVEAIYDLTKHLDAMFWSIDTHQKGEIKEVKFTNKGACPSHRTDVIAKAAECEHRKLAKQKKQLNNVYYLDNAIKKPEDSDEKTEKDLGT